jgi:hypothetical protein
MTHYRLKAGPIVTARYYDGSLESGYEMMKWVAGEPGLVWQTGPLSHGPLGPFEHGLGTLRITRAYSEEARLFAKSEQWIVRWADGTTKVFDEASFRHAFEADR